MILIQKNFLIKKSNLIKSLIRNLIFFKKFEKKIKFLIKDLKIECY